MTATSIGAAALSALGGLRPARATITVQPLLKSRPVRALEAGTFETQFFVAPDKGATNKVLKAAKQLSAARPALRGTLADRQRSASRFERQVLAVNRNVVAVLEELLELARTQAGKVYPSYAWLVTKTGISRATIARALSVLEALGFIVRQRRFKRVEIEGIGPRYKQVSNAYQTTLPKRVLAYLPRWMQSAPIPVDQQQHITDDDAATKAMLDTLTRCDYAKATTSGSLGDALASLGASLDRKESESQSAPQTLVESFTYQFSRRGLVMLDLP